MNNANENNNSNNNLDNANYKILEEMIRSRTDVILENIEEIIRLALYFASLEEQRTNANDQSIANSEFAEYLSLLNGLFDDDDSLDSCINSSFTFVDGTCYHEVKNIDSKGDSSLMMFTAFKDDEMFRNGLLKKACVGYSRRNPLDDVQVIVNPRMTGTYLVNSYSTDGNILSVNNVPSDLARELYVNLQRIPADLYQSKSKNASLALSEKQNGFTGFFGLAIIVIAVTFVIGVLITIGILQ